MKRLSLNNSNTNAAEFLRIGMLPMHKSLLGLAVGFLSFVGSVQAQGITLPEGTTGLTPLQGTVKTVQQVRIPVSPTVTAVETQVTLEFTLQGCLDNLLPLIHHYEVQGNRATIYVTALNADNVQSQSARCIAVPKAEAQVQVPGVFQQNQIRVVYLHKL
jgi:hypothetical protein